MDGARRDTHCRHHAVILNGVNTHTSTYSIGTRRRPGRRRAVRRPASHVISTKQSQTSIRITDSQTAAIAALRKTIGLDRGEVFAAALRLKLR